jgi:CHAT domain-containing protein/tetratricopeptide (TPR) repeat protein
VQLYLGAARGQSLSGQPDASLDSLLVGLKLAREYHLRVREASALQGLGHAYQNRGDLLQASAFFAESLRIMRETNDTEEYVWALASAGVVAREDGDYAKAIELHDEAVSRAMNPIAKVRTLRELGLDYYSSQDFPKAIEQFRKSLAVKLQDPRHHAYSDVKRNLAQALVDQASDGGDAKPATLREASRLLDETLESSLNVGDKLGVMGAHRVRGNLLAVQGHTRQALDEFHATFALARDFRDKSSSTEAKGATLTHEQYALRGFLDVSLKDVAARGAGQPRRATAVEEAALVTLETARDTYFGPARPGELDAETSARVDSLLQQMADKSVRIATLLHEEDTPARATELATLQADMSDLHAELDQLRTAAAAKRVANTGLAAAVLTMRELAPGTVQISYALGNRHVYAWTRSAEGVQVTMLPKAPRELERELIALAAVDRQAQPAAIEKALAQMSADLLPPGLLPKDATSIEIVSEGRIAAVPFAGLTSPDSPGHRLVETHSLTMVTSMFSGEPAPRGKQTRPFRLVALASGTSGLRSVPVINPVAKLRAASSEIRSVASFFTAIDPRANIRLMVSPEGTAAELRRIWASGADVVHFATHALADLRQPQASLLVMPATTAHGDPTYLTAGQVEGWRGDAELVFLSACDSAIGPPRYAGGMPGLQRAFLRAGARGVIATLWPIEDVMAQEFSADFYRRYTRGESAAQALGETQREWMTPNPSLSADDRARRRITALAHGFYRQ